MPSLIQFYELPLIGILPTSIFKVIIFLPNILILWRKFRAEGEIFYGVDGTNEIDEECGYSEFREFKEALRLMRTKETIGTTTKLKHQKKKLQSLLSLSILSAVSTLPIIPRILPQLAR